MSQDESDTSFQKKKFVKPELKIHTPEDISNEDESGVSEYVFSNLIAYASG